MIKQILALGQTITLPAELEESDVTEKENFLSILKEIDGVTAGELERVEFSVRIEGESAVVYRTGATMG